MQMLCARPATCTLFIWNYFAFIVQSQGIPSNTVDMSVLTAGAAKAEPEIERWLRGEGDPSVGVLHPVFLDWVTKAFKITNICVSGLQSTSFSSLHLAWPFRHAYSDIPQMIFYLKGRDAALNEDTHMCGLTKTKSPTENSFSQLLSLCLNPNIDWLVHFEQQSVGLLSCIDGFSRIRDVKRAS